MTITKIKNLKEKQKLNDEKITTFECKKKLTL